MQFEELPKVIKFKILDVVIEKIFENFFDSYILNVLGVKLTFFKSLKSMTQDFVKEKARELFELRKDAFMDIAITILVCNDFRIEANSDKVIFPVNFNIEQVSKDVMRVYSD